jgi:hypothetical protein
MESVIESRGLRVSAGKCIFDTHRVLALLEDRMDRASQPVESGDIEGIRHLLSV